MPHFEAPDWLQTIDPGAFLPGQFLKRAVGDRNVDLLRLQHNTLVGGAGSPWLCAGIPNCGAGEEASLEIPPQPGLRMVALGVGDTGVLGYAVTLTDDVGAFVTVALAAHPAWRDAEWTRSLSGWITARLVAGPAGSDAVGITVAPVPPDTSTAGQEADGYLCEHRTDDDRPVSVGLVNRLCAAVTAAWARPQIFHTYLDPNGWRGTAGTTETFAAHLPLPSRGRALGLSVQAAGSAAATVSLLVGPTSTVCTGFPPAQGAIIRAAATDPILPGYVVGDLQVVIPGGGSLTIYSVSVYEYPE
jgi:hypothetical protein